MRDGRVLLGRRSPHRAYYPGVWDLIGGHVEEGESPHAAMVREVEEEIGCVPTVYRLLEIAHEPNPELNGPGEFHVFLVTEWSGPAPRALNDELDALDWFDRRALSGLRLADPACLQVLYRIESLV